MVKAWVADVSPLYEKECYESYYRALPDFRRNKADALRSEGKKAQSIGVWALWMKIRKEYGLPEDTMVNFSHSGKYVMCAAVMESKENACEESRVNRINGAGNKNIADSGMKGKVYVGCDLEKTGTFRENVAKRFFCPEEYETIMSGKTKEDRAELFYRYWVLKESFMKATGKGMALPVDSFCIRLGEPPLLIRQPEEFPLTYHYMEYKIDKVPYKMAVCSTDKEIDIKLHLELRL